MRKQFSKWISLFLAAGMVMTTPASVMAEDVISGSEPVTVTGSSDAGSPTEEAEQTREKGKTEVVAKDASKDGKKEETEPTADETADEAEKEAVSLPSEYTDGTADLSGIDFSSKRLIVGTEDAAVTENDPDVVEALDGMYLIQYATEQEAQNAYQYYTEHADFVEVDTGIKSADNTANSDDEDAPKTDGTEDAAIVTDPMTEEENPFTELIEEEETAKSIETYQGKQAYDIALIDTGASEYTDNGVSMIGSNTDDENGHGTKMAQIIKEEDPDTAILSVKALDKDGIGTVSSVYAAIEYAISQDVKIINLSLSGVAKADSRSIEDAVNEAVDAGIVVVGAAGNDGKNVKYYIPGKINSAVIVGACDKNGNRLGTSNYGDTVDYYVTAGSTSEAAARFSGLLAKNGFAVDDAAKADGVFTADGLSLHTENKGETEEEKGETKLSAADTVTATSGTWGTCPWSFDSTTGALTIGAGTGVRGSTSSLGSDYPWYNFRTKITNINLTGAVHLPVNSSWLFSGCTSLTSIVNCTNLDTSNVTNMSSMFDSCSALTSLDISSFNTSKVTNMSFMFNKCSALTSLDVSSFDTSKVTDMCAMFQNCSSLTNLNVSKFNTSKVTDMSYMFYGCSVLAGLDVSSFDTSKVTNMRSMFNSCSSLTNLNVSKFNTSNVTNMRAMFENCSSLTSLDLSKFNTSNVTNMSIMFNKCGALTSLDLSKFDTSNVTNMLTMFYNCTSLTSLDVSSFDTSNVTNMDAMLANNTSLSKITIGPNFVIPANNNNDLFPTSIAKTYSGQLTNNKWGLGSENATSSYSGDDLIKLGQTKGKLAGTWYAQAAKKYTLTYNGNGGTPSTASATGYETKTWGTLASATRTGYTFQGWYTAASGGTQVTSSTPCTTSLTVYAHWKANSYTISFDANGGSGTTASVSATYDGNMPSITNGISRSGYTFTGFYDTKTGGTKYYNADGSSARTWNKAANKTLYAQWTLTPYKFDVNPQSHVTGFRLKKNDADADNGTTIGDYYADAHMEDVFYLYSPTFATGYEFSSFTKQYGPGSQSTSGSTATITMGAGAQAIAINAKPITYTISYNLNGGSVGGNPSSYNIESAAFTLKNPTRTGYTFTGWTGSNGSTPQTSVAVSKGSTGNRSYTANWAANTNTKYTVIHQQEQLDGTYKTVDTQNLTGTTDTSVTPAVKSYTGFTAPSTQTITIKGDGTASVTYKYTRNSYTVTRQYRLQNADGSYNSYMQIDSKSYKYGTSIAAWTRSADDTYKAASIAVHTVAAKNETLSVNVDRKTASVALQYRLQNADGTYPTSFTSGWTGTLRVGENHTWAYTQTTSHSAVSKTVTYGDGTVSVDVPRRTGRLVIKANGGSSDRTTAAIRYGSTSDTISPLPTRTGYTLTGLYTTATGGTKVVNASGTMANDGTYSTDGTWLLNSDVTVYAQWTVNTYKISYTLNGGTNASGNPSSYTIESDAISLAAPTRTGYTFTGWTGSNGTTAQTSVTIAKGSTGDKNYTANWKANSYTVKFDANGGTGTITDEDFTYDQSKALSANTFKRKFYTFAGWNIKKDGSGTQYADLASAKNLATSGDVTLYAQWTANTYTVSIPTAINYKNMQTGAVSTSNAYDITVKNQTGSFGDTVKVQAANGELNAANGSSDKLTATAGSSSSPLPFTEDGSKQDSISITGTTHTADKWTGSVQYSVTIE